MYPILFQLGSVTVYSFGFFLIIAYIAVAFIFWKEGKRQGYPEEKLLDLSLIALISAFVGGRAFFVFTHYDLFRKQLLSIFSFWEGGFVFYGALVGVLAAVFVTCRKWKWPFLQIADFGALAALAAYTLVKIGALFAGIDFGTPTSLPWGVEFENLDGARHPVQLYEAVSAAVFFIVMRLAYERNLKSANFRSGRVFFISVFLVSVSRFFLGFLQADVTYFSGLRLDQIVSLLVAIVAVFSIYYLKLRDFNNDFETAVKTALSINSRAFRKIKFWR